MRRIKAKAPALDLSQRESFSKTFQMELLTPMAGGGSGEKTFDEDQPIRATGIKQQLRFWWRALQGPIRPGTMEEVNSQVKALKAREDAIFGSTNWGSRVHVSVEQGPAGKVDPRGNNPAKYAALNLWYQDKKYMHNKTTGQQGDKGFPVLTHHTFQLTIGWERPQSSEIEQSDDAEAYWRENLRDAFFCWVLFGGVGARTSRGCGSVYCEEVMKIYFPTIDKVKNFLLARDSIDAEDSLAPVIQKATFKFGVPPKHLQNNPHDAWNEMIKTYQRFRQHRRKYSRSYWPEPNTIRHEIYPDGPKGKVPWDPKHKYIKPERPWFPRAAYGLPIQFKFKDKKIKGKVHEDFETTLYPQGRERWPSPLILKIIRTGDQEIARIALVLNAIIPELEMRNEKRGTKKVLPDFHPRAVGRTQKQCHVQSFEDIYTSLFDVLFKPKGGNGS